MKKLKNKIEQKINETKINIEENELIPVVSIGVALLGLLTVVFIVGIFISLLS